METTLDSYNSIVEALKTHTGQVSNLLERKNDQIDQRLSNIRFRLAALASKTATTERLTKEQQENLHSLLKEAGLTAESAHMLNHIRMADLREAQKLQGVATNAIVAKKMCQDCKGAAVPSMSLRGALCVILVSMTSLFF
jgi:hypothetical protein